jgi:AraC-like DNA-binding protein
MYSAFSTSVIVKSSQISYNIISKYNIMRSNSMRKWLAKKNTTFIKYFLSYFIVLSVSFLGFSFAVQYEIKGEYMKNLNKQNVSRIENISSLISSSFNELNQSQNILMQNLNLILSRYTNDDSIHYQAFLDLKNQIVGNSFISDIIYIDRITASCISTQYLIQYKNNSFKIFFEDKFVDLPVDQLSSSEKSCYTILKGKKDNLILYSPSQASTRYSFIFVINKLELKNLMQVDSDLYSICLTDNNNNIVYGINQKELLSFLSKDNHYEAGSYPIDKSSIAYVTPTVNYQFQIIALSNKMILLQDVNMAFKKTYLLLIAIGIIGLFIIVFSMQMTYAPLHKLTKNIAEDASPNSNYIQQINNVFNASKVKNQQLQDKVNDYRMVMQHSIIDSIVLESNSNSLTHDMEQIDQFFNPSFNNSFFVVKIVFTHSVLEPNYIKEYITLALPSDSSCISLELNDKYSVFLINYTGSEHQKGEVIRLFFDDFSKETGCRIAISNNSSNPLDIPSLYENAMLVSEFLSKDLVVSYNDIGDKSFLKTTVSYPYKRLESLTNALEELDFANTHIILQELLNIISENNNPDFFIRCVLLDILTSIVNLMNKSNIKFEKFSEIYFETLYFCRSCKYSTKTIEISNNIHNLLTIFDKEIANMTIHISQIKQLLMENYLSSDFSITLLADHFHVSIAYMSYLFKKKTNLNLSDYVWELRLEKAKELLITTDMPIDDISVTIGYLNSSSFRRKFKQTTNISPSQYRREQTLK